MSPEVAARLIAINRHFYDTVAAPFARSRAAPQPGFERAVEALPATGRSLLDVGAGEGRFARYLLNTHPLQRYVAIDGAEALLAVAAETVSPLAPECACRYFHLDMNDWAGWPPFAPFDIIACLAALQHIPSRQSRVALLQKLAELLMPEGRLLLSTWQFMASERQRRKLRGWEEVNLSTSDVEDGDYLLSWDRGVSALRYVCLIDDIETERLASESGLAVASQFRADGREGNLNLYTILRRA